MNMKLNELLQEYENDMNINQNKLDYESIMTPKLHSKYLKLLMEARGTKVVLENSYNNLRMLRFRYYRGELSKEELAENGWAQYQGTKPLKNEMDEILKGCPIILKEKQKIDISNEKIYALEEMIKQIRARDWNIRNAIEFKKFQAGA